MYQVIAYGARFNPATVPEYIICKVTGEDERAKREAEATIRRAKAAARDARVARSVIRDERSEAVCRRVTRRSMLRRLMEPIETAWALVYACATLWPGEICGRVIRWGVRKGLIREGDD